MTRPRCWWRRFSAGETYVERAVLTGDMEFAVSLPFAMTVLAASIFS